MPILQIYKKNIYVDRWGSDPWSSNMMFMTLGHFPTFPLGLHSPSLCLVCVAKDTGGLLRGHPLRHLGVELRVELILLHPLELKLGIKFLERGKVITVKVIKSKQKVKS